MLPVGENGRTSYGGTCDDHRMVRYIVGSSMSHLLFVIGVFGDRRRRRESDGLDADGLSGAYGGGGPRVGHAGRPRRATGRRNTRARGDSSL